MKTITTGTEITFTKTGEKFTLTQTDTGFDVRQIKLSKNVPAENYSFQELLDLYEAGQIVISGFEEADAALVRSSITNHIHASALKQSLVKISQLEAKVQDVEKYQEKIKELEYEKQELEVMNKNLTEKVEKLNEALEAMNEEETA